MLDGYMLDGYMLDGYMFVWILGKWKCLPAFDLIYVLFVSSRSSIVVGWRTPPTGQARVPRSSTLANCRSHVVPMPRPIAQSEVIRWDWFCKKIPWKLVDLILLTVQVFSDGCEEAVNEFLETNIDIIGGAVGNYISSYQRYHICWKSYFWLDISYLLYFISVVGSHICCI